MKLQELFPAGVQTAVAVPVLDCSILFEEEWKLVQDAVGKRQSEFCGGRKCARAVLTGLGYPKCAVGANPDRSPKWPEGIVGSITHSTGLCAAVAGRMDQFLGLGLDIESDEPLDDDIIPMICHGEELDLLQLSPQPEKLAKLIFCIKEAAYKCQYPLTHCMLEFHDARVHVDLAGGSFEVRFPNMTLPGTGKALNCQGRFGRKDSVILAGAFILPKAVPIA